MSQESQKVIAIFSASGPKDEKNDEAKQAVLRECATMLCLTIVSCVALPKASLFQCLSQILGMCRSNAASALLVDEINTLFLSPKELRSFFKILQEQKIGIITARSRIILSPEYLAIFADFLELSARVERAQHAQGIRKSLLLRKRQGIKLGGKKFGAVHDENEIIKQILELHVSGKSLQDICNILITNDIQSTHNKKWYPTTIKRIIDREKKIKGHSHSGT